MTQKNISDASITLHLFRHIYSQYRNTELKLSGIYHSSHACRLATRFCSILKICLRYSFLGRITETKQKTSTILDTSRTAQFLIKCYKNGKDKLIHSFKASSVVEIAKNRTEQNNFSPLKLISITVAVAVVVNVILIIVLQKHISLWGWMMRGLLIFVSISALFCQADWPIVKKSSTFFKLLRIDYKLKH